jgi:putative ABC transport system permease protein
MSVALAVAVTTLVGSFRTTVEDYVNQTIRSDLWIRPPAPKSSGFLGRLDREIVQIAIDTFGADVVDPFHEVSIVYAGQPVALCAGEFRVFQRAAMMPFRDGRDPKKVFAEAIEQRGAFVSEPFANRFGVKEGDRLTIETPKGPIVKPVLGVFYDYSRTQGMIILDRQEFLESFPDDGPREMALFLHEGDDPQEARERLRKRLGGRFMVVILANRQLRTEAMRVFDRTFAITSALQLVSSAVALIAIAAVLTALVDERRQDLALLRALGGSRAEVFGVVLCQGEIMGAFSAAAGLAAGLATGWILVHVVNLQSFAWTMRFVPPWGSVLGVAGAVLPACLAAGLPPAWRASRAAPRELLRDDS